MILIQRSKILGHWIRKRMEREKEQNICTTKKYVACGLDEKWRRKRRKYLEKENMGFRGGE